MYFVNMNQDELFMRHAVQLAKKARGKTSPNPMVGAVITKNGQIIGEGYHKKAGLPHAEIEAMNSVKNKDDLTGATIYVNLEPCNHFGRTPPCSEAIIKSGIKRVVIGMRDPNLKARGGAERLKQNGIEVKIGVLEKDVNRLNEIFITNITKLKPFFVMKAAMLLNGNIAVKGGVSKWITSEKSLRFSHKLRGLYDAVIVGINTVIMDDPMLTCRIRGYKQPKRVILDANLRIPLSSKLFSKYPNNIYIITNHNRQENKIRTLLAMGANIIECDTEKGVFIPEKLSQALLQYDICSALVEGGSRAHGYFLTNSLYDKAYLFYAPKITGSYGAFNVVGADAPYDLEHVHNLKNAKCRDVGDDFLIEGYF